VVTKTWIDSNECQARILWRNLSTRHRTTPNKTRLRSKTWQHMSKNFVNLMRTAKIKLTKNWLRHSNRHCQPKTIIPRTYQYSKISNVFLQSMTTSWILSIFIMKQATITFKLTPKVYNIIFNYTTHTILS